MTMLLEWVITSIFLILTVLALRAVFGKRVSARLRYALWAVVLARLLVPVQLFTSPLAGTRFFSGGRTEQTVTQWPITSGAHAAPGPDDVLSPDFPDEPHEPLTHFPAAPQAPEPPTVPIAPAAPAAPDLTKLPAWLGWVWLGGSIVLALVLAASNLRFALRLRRGRIPLEEADCPLPVYEAAGLPSPCLFGLIRPAVYVTPDAAADPAMLRHVLAHEYTHFRQGDHLWSLLRCAALAAHWWDPLVWLAVALSRRDGELSCDEGALKRLGDGERLAYGNTLLALVTAKPGPGDLLCFATTMAGEKRSLKERVGRIAHAPRRWLWAAAAMVLATALACVCAFGRAQPEADGNPSGPAESGTPSESDLPAYDLSFSIDESGSVAITGRAYDLELESCFWHPAADAMHPISYLFMRCPDFDSGIAGFVDAVWGDDEHSTVVMNTSAMAAVSSWYPTGYWTFTVDVSGEQAVVTDIHPVAPDNLNESAGKLRLYPETVTEQQAVAAARIAARLLTEAEDYYQNHAGEPAGPDGRLQTDLDRDGIRETVQVKDLDGGAGQRLELWEGGVLIYAEEGRFAHAGANAVFLCTLDGKDYLLRYRPYMAQGFCEYSYELFTLENGVETVVQESRVEFDVNFGSPIHADFDPEAIAAFMGEVNALLARSVQLINTDDGLLDVFREAGRLYDGRWWPDPSVSMVESLWEFKASMEANYPSVLLGQSQFILLQDEAGQYYSMDDVPALICGDDPYAKIWSFAAVDMDGDGADEVLVQAYGNSADSLGYLLLRQENGAVCGTIFNARNNWSNCWFYSLKADGTFECYDPADRWESVSKLFFTAGGGVGIYGLTVIRNDPDYDLESFMSVRKEAAREEDWLAAVQAQREKADVEWYDFNTENITTVF